MQRSIVLIGFMGTGKTTVGSVLSERLGWPFLDSDQVIVEREQRAIADIFERDGESYFRDVEEKVIRDLLKKPKQVISMGGGAVLRETNREEMLKNAFVVALKTSPKVLLERMRTDTTRPLLAGNKEEQIRKLLEERKTAYDFAHFTADTSEWNAEQAAEMIAAAYASDGAWS